MKNLVMVLLTVWFVLPSSSIGSEGPGSAGEGLQSQEMIRQMLDFGLSDGTAEGLASAMREARFTHDDTEQVMAQLRLVQRNQDALSAIVGKVHEGIAKQVRPGAIVRAVVRVRERQSLATATAQSFKVKHQQRLIPVIADALVSGLSKQELSQLTQQLQAREPELRKEQFSLLAQETRMTVRDMVRYGVQSTTAASVATKAIAVGYGADDMRMLRRILNDQRIEANMEAVCQRMLQGLSQGVQAGEMRGFAMGAANGSSSGKGGGSSGNGGGGSGHGGSGGHGGGSGGGGGHGGGR